MKRKTYKPFDFSQSLQDAAPEHIDEAVASLTADPDADLDIVHPEPEPQAAAPLVAPIGRLETPRPTSAHRALSEARTSLRAQPAAAKGGGGWLYLCALIVSILWVAAPIAFFAGPARGVAPFNSEPFTIVVLALLAIGPIGLIWVLAFVLNQGVRLAGEARFARAQADDMIRPAAIAAAGAGGAAEMIRHEIEQAVSAASQARHELITLREVLASETANLVEAAASSARTAASLTQSVGEERRELSALTTVLEAQVESVEEAITRQSQLVTQAADLAEAQIREAGAMLSASTGDLATAAGEASGAAKIAGEDLGRQVARLEAAGTVVVEQIQTVEDSLAEQRAALVQVAYELRAEQEGFGAEVESRQAQLSGILSQVRTAAGEIGESAQVGGDALRILVENAADRFRDLGEAVAEERDLFGAEMLKSLGAISEAARNERELMVDSAHQSMEALSLAAIQATQAAQTQSDAARLKVDQLSEASFAAGQQADAAFESRLSEARTLIEQSASLVEDAGARAGERLIQGLNAAQNTVEKLEALLQEVDARTARLPADAEARSAQVKAVVEQGVEDLLGAARRAADETQAIDAAFQDRVRRNYEMLSEAVRLMGVVGGAPSAVRTQRPPRPPVVQPLAPPAEPQPDASAAALTETLALRPRLKLTPEAIDEQVFVSGPAPVQATAVQSQPTERSLTWKQILSSVEDESPDEDGPDLTVIEEIRLLGIDPAALLPQSRVSEIAPVLQAGDKQGAREIVRQLAPAAMRRLSRNVLADNDLRDRVTQMIRQFERRLDTAVSGEAPDRALMGLLATDEGRVFLLIDSAVSDLP